MLLHPNYNSMKPEKIYVEITTRCNLHCQKCVKHTAGSHIKEQDMPLAVFKELLPSLPYTGSLILNGIGEPLLHPHLLEFVRLARSTMPSEATVGFQTNGVLLDENYSLQLIESGLDTLCLSVDGLREPSFLGDSQEGHSFSVVEKAVASIDLARKKAAVNFKIGLEVVLQKNTLNDLPDLVTWACNNGVDYIITTHLILYDNTHKDNILFDPNSREAVELFQKCIEIASSKKVDLEKAYTSYIKYAGTRSNDTALKIFTDMQEEAKEKDLRLNIQSLIAHNKSKNEEIDGVLQKARNIADAKGIQLFLPPLRALDQRSCPFITENATFIAPNGDVTPCHFLWHSYSCRVLQEEIQIQKRAFGNILKSTLETIWQSDIYQEFRDEAGRYEYSSCWSCPLGPCSTTVNDNLSDTSDCYGSRVPCGHCQWNLGSLRCL